MKLRPHKMTIVMGISALLLILTIPLLLIAFTPSTESRIDRVSNTDELVIYMPGNCENLPPGPLGKEYDDRFFGCYSTFSPSNNVLKSYPHPKTFAGCGVRLNSTRLLYYKLAISELFGVVPGFMELSTENPDPFIGDNGGSMGFNYYKWVRSYYNKPDWSLIDLPSLVDLSSCTDSNLDIVHLVGVTDVGDIIYLLHRIDMNVFDHFEVIGQGQQAVILKGDLGPIIFYIGKADQGLDTLGKWNYKGANLVKKELRDGKWQPRRGLVFLKASSLDVIQNGNEFLALCTLGRRKSLSSAVLVRISGDTISSKYTLPAERIKGNILQPRLRAVSGRIEIYNGLDDSGTPQKVQFTDKELETYRSQ